MAILDYLTMSSVSTMTTRSIVISLCLTHIVGGSLGAKYLQPNEENVEHVFHSYIKTYARNYENNDEHEMRKTIFLENWKMIEHHNHQNLSYTMKVNKFSDRTPEEMMASLGGSLPSPAGHQGLSGLQGYRPFPYSADEVKTLAKALPKNFDMRRDGYISSVKDQGTCGSCWAFAAVGAVEGALARKLGKHRFDFSEQAVVDCAPPDAQSHFGCKGNHLENAFEYILTKGLLTEKEYPYTEETDPCHAEYMEAAAKIEGYSQPIPNDPDAMRVALYHLGPVVARMHFSTHMLNYHEGIFLDPKCNSGGINHDMVVVGYGTEAEDGVDYWILKNSHGTGWGNRGYGLISAKDNHCFILSYPLYPIV